MTMRTILSGTSTVALVGASDKEERPANEVMKILQDYGYRVIPINPRLQGQMLLGERVLASLEELPAVLEKTSHVTGIKKGTEATSTSGEQGSANIDRKRSLHSTTASGIMVDIFRRSETAGEVVDQAIALGKDIVSSIWLQIGVIDHEAAQRALDAGFYVAMDVCPAEEIPRLKIAVPLSTKSLPEDDAPLDQPKRGSSSTKQPSTSSSKCSRSSLKRPTPKQPAKK